MKKRTFLVSILIFLFSISLSAQTENDDIEFYRVKNQIEGNNYRMALEILSNNISESGKMSPFYFQYYGDCYERLTLYDSAAYYYLKQYQQTKSDVAMKKVAEMRDKQDAKMNCSLCHGSGGYYKMVNCTECMGKGNKTSKCYSCKGNGKCNDCDGKGYWIFHNSINGEDEEMKCSSCRGHGECHSCEGTGKKSEKCYLCNGSGKINQKIVCRH